MYPPTGPRVVPRTAYFVWRKRRNDPSSVTATTLTNSRDSTHGQSSITRPSGSSTTWLSTESHGRRSRIVRRESVSHGRIGSTLRTAPRVDGMEGDGAGRGHVQRLGATRQLDRDPRAVCCELVRQALRALRPGGTSAAARDRRGRAARRRGRRGPVAARGGRPSRPAGRGRRRPRTREAPSARSGRRRPRRRRRSHRMRRPSAARSRRCPDRTSRQSARHSSPRLRSAGRRDGRRRSSAPDAAASTRRASSASSTVSPATSRWTGLIPASARPRTRSSPSAANSPVASRCLRCPSSLPTSLSVSLSRDVITAAGTSRASCRGSRAAPRGAPIPARRGARARSARAALVGVRRPLALVAAPGRDPGERSSVGAGLVQRPAQPRGRLGRQIARRGRLEDERHRVLRPRRRAQPGAARRSRRRSARAGRAPRAASRPRRRAGARDPRAPARRSSARRGSRLPSSRRSARGRSRAGDGCRAVARAAPPGTLPSRSTPANRAAQRPGPTCRPRIGSGSGRRGD